MSDLKKAAENLVRVANHIHAAEMAECQQPKGSLARAVCDARGCKCQPKSAAKSHPEGRL